MTFKHCVLIALTFHLALLLCPMKEHINSNEGNVVLVVTEKVGFRANEVAEAPAKPLQPVKKIVHPEKEHDRDKPLRVVQPEKPKIEKALQKRPDRSTHTKVKKKQQHKKDTKPAVKVQQTTLPVDNNPEADGAREKVVPEYNRIPTQKESAPICPIADADAEETVHGKPQEVVFGSAEGPRFLRRILPEYPLKERRLGTTGVVVLMLTIDAEGVLIDVEVVDKSNCNFEKAAIEAVTNSSFVAAQRNGRPVGCKAVLPIRFKLR